MIDIKFQDFSRLCDEHRKRIYYFETLSYIELYFISDTIPVRTVVQKSDIENPDTFRAQKMFTGSIQLNRPLVRLPEQEVPITDNTVMELNTIMSKTTEEEKQNTLDEEARSTSPTMKSPTNVVDNQVV